MKKIMLFVALAMLAGCNKVETVTTGDENVFSSEITVKSPVPKRQIDRIALSGSQKALVSGSNVFSLRLLDNLRTEDRSMVFSPLSIALDLAMVANGTSGTARQEILDALGYDGEDITVYNDYCKRLIDGLPAVDLSSRISIANAILADSSYPVKDSFKSAMADNYYSLVESLPFTNWSQVRSRINKWVSDCTEGLIPEMLNESTSASVSILLNALYLKAGLSFPFGDSFSSVFHSGKKDVTLPFMGGLFQIPYTSNEFFEAVCLPLGNEKLGISVYLPREEVEMEDVIAQLKDRTEWGHWGKTCDVNVRIPKFKTESSFRLIPSLEEIGISQVFQICPFDNMLQSTLPFRVGTVLHKATLSLDENGIEAAAATAIGIDAIAPPSYTQKEYIEFTADRPFLYLVQERTTGIILFAGIFNG